MKWNRFDYVAATALIGAMLCGFVYLTAQSPPASTAAPFTALETARLDALSQEGRALDAEQRTLTLLRERWQGKVAAFKAAAEQDRPGWTWNAETGQWSEVKK